MYVRHRIATLKLHDDSMRFYEMREHLSYLRWNIIVQCTSDKGVVCCLVH